MRIYLTHEKFTFCIPFPTRLVLNKPVIKIANWAVKNYCPGEIPYIEPEYANMLYREIKNSRKKHGRKWDLVDVQSATGDGVRIRL